MSGKYHAKTDPDDPLIYQIKVQGHLDDRWADWFGDFTIASEENGVTVLTGVIVDQAALHGFLKKIRDLSLPLRSINLVHPDQSAQNREL